MQPSPSPFGCGENVESITTARGYKAPAKASTERPWRVVRTEHLLALGEGAPLEVRGPAPGRGWYVRELDADGPDATSARV